MNVLVCNAGSTSLKFKLYDMPSPEVLAEGKVERVGSTDNAIFHYTNEKKHFAVVLENQCIPDYTTGIQMFLARLLAPESGALQSLEEIARVGFKSVLSKDHYGVHAIDDKVLQGMEDYMVVAPAHNTAYLSAIRQFQALLPHTLMVGVFETAFHTTIPQERYTYSIPYAWTETYGIRRMGYHGASHGYVADCITALEGPGRKVISCHLGGSCSLCAIDDGKSVDNSFGFSLQCGVLHSNRSGDIDPFIIAFMAEQGLSVTEIFQTLSKNGGLKGVSGVSADLRLVKEAAAAGNERAVLAVKMFETDILRCIGSYYVELEGLTDLVFTAGIGENDAELRSHLCAHLKHMGVKLDEAKNRERRKDIRCISAEDSAVKVYVIPANEELGVARRTYAYNP